MQWDVSALAGFSTHEPWLPLSPDHEIRNVVAMSNDKTSILFFGAKFTPLSATTCGAFPREVGPIVAKSGVLAYERCDGDSRIFIILNFTADPQAWSAPTSNKAKVAISTHGDRRGEPVGSTLALRANEGLLIEPVC